MLKLCKNTLFRALLSTLIFGGLYALFLFLFNGMVDGRNLLISVVVYFVVLNLTWLLIPWLGKRMK